VSNLTDPHFLKEQQYKSADNLEARIRLHRDYSVQAQDWHRWVFDQLTLANGERVMEMGCGPASLWRENMDRLPAGLCVVLSDLSWGMGSQARQNMARAANFRFLTMDVQSIPYPNAQFEVLIANHMLYHVPDLPRAVGELRRVLKPGGRLFTATNGIRHMQELFDLVNAFDPRAQRSEDFQKRFCLENAAEVLGQSFEQVEILPFESRLEVTEVRPLVDYILSMSSFWGIFDRSARMVNRLEQFLTEKMAVEGKIVIQKSGGLAVAFS
jgi:ubiquinone/menaquinone biosynthesis C-methylase UbiE